MTNDSLSIRELILFKSTVSDQAFEPDSIAYRPCLKLIGERL